MRSGVSVPIDKKWSSFTKERVSSESDNFGVYEIGNSSGDVLYIGEGKVKTQLLSHFNTGNAPVVGASVYRCEYTRSKDKCVSRQNALLRDHRKKHDGKNPPFNKKSKA
jgi:hypothetical protein